VAERLVVWHKDSQTQVLTTELYDISLVARSSFGRGMSSEALYADPAPKLLLFDEWIV
jgi:hypothetical protein